MTVKAVQEHLPVEQCRLASAVCVMMDLLVKCEGSELLRILRKGLLSSPDLPQVAGTAKRTRKAGGKKAAKGKVLGESELDVRSHNLLVHTLFNSYISTCVFRTVWEVISYYIHNQCDNRQCQKYTNAASTKHVCPGHTHVFR